VDRPLLGRVLTRIILTGLCSIVAISLMALFAPRLPLNYLLEAVYAVVKRSDHDGFFLSIQVLNALGSDSDINKKPVVP